MIDTIKLTLGKGMFFLTDISLFQKEKMNSARGYFSLVQNPTKGELRQGIYKPRLTLTKRFNYSGRFEPTLSIELSLPKLLYGNNFDELKEADFPIILSLLQGKLKEMGVDVFIPLLSSAPVSTVHYSKNIPLTDGTTPYFYISKIKEANLKLSIDSNQTDYRNDGLSYKWHTNSYEVAWYDKIKDYEYSKMSDKRSFEKDNEIQLSLFESLRQRKPFEVLRFEVRLNKRQKMDQLFRILKISSSCTFKEIFSKEISRKVLLYYLTEIERQRPKLLDYEMKSTDILLAELRINNPKMTLRRALMICGMKQAIATMSLREIRAMYGGRSERTWYRLMTDAKKINLPKTKDYFISIRSNLETFKSIKLVDFQDRMINNDKYS